MSRLRTRLRPAQSAYRAARYPGNLAEELLEPEEVPRRLPRSPWLTFGASCAAAATVALVMLPRLFQPQATVSPLASQSPFATSALFPRDLPLPHFEAPLALSPPDLRVPTELPPAVGQYQDMAMQYRQFRLPESLKSATVPTIPTDLPSRGLEWIQKVWTQDRRAPDPNNA